MAATIPSSIVGDFKERYNTKGIQDAIPESRVILKSVEFDKAALVGNAFHTPVILSDEAGFTYAANNAGNYALNGPTSLNVPDAQVRPSQITLVSQIASRQQQRAVGAMAAEVGPGEFGAARCVAVRAAEQARVVGADVLADDASAGRALRRVFPRRNFRPEHAADRVQLPAAWDVHRPVGVEQHQHAELAVPQ